MSKTSFPLHLAGTFACLIAGIFCIYYFDGTGDAGDSVQHYLFARFAPQHPALYFDHWAKPLYVLVASPFAQFGFIGVKWMNVVLAALTALLTSAIARQLGMKQSGWIFLFQYFAPYYFAMTFSGLTEYLFAFFLSLSLFLQFRKQVLWAALVVSFLPFIRSEGLLFAGIFLVYYLRNNNLKAAAILLTGHVLYSIAGFFVYSDFLWVFRRNPYAKLSSTYGHGTPFHFAAELYYILGLPLYLLLLAGLIRNAWEFFRRKLTAEWMLFVPGAFLVFFIAHSIFWYFGIFNSMGLKRVFLAVMPLMSLLMLSGFNRLSNIKVKGLRVFLTAGILVFVVVFPFLDNHAALHPKEQLVLRPDQVAANALAKKLPAVSGKIFYNHPYLGMSLETDPFDPAKTGKLTAATNGTAGDILIWDSWFSTTEAGLKENELQKSGGVQFLFSVASSDNLSKFSVYRRK